jgi:thiol-disulfide isomerase/thioredoxin
MFMITRFFILVLLPLLSFGQTDTSLKSIVSTKAVKTIFKNACGKEVPSAVYMEMANSGLFTISYSVDNDTTIVYRLDSTQLLKSIGSKRTMPTLKDIQGKRYQLPANTPIVVNFWSTTCKPCIEEIDKLNLIKKQFKNVLFLAITPDEPGIVKKFLEHKTFEYKLVFLSQKQIQDKLHVDNYPTHMIIDKKGHLRWVYIGTPAILPQKIEAYSRPTSRRH